tara:strand:+ start:775 stop:2043 length:1269 start_codon:yes stop_codon:yes gene_type:complete
MAEKKTKEEIVRIDKVKQEAVLELEVKAKAIVTTKKAVEATKEVGGARPVDPVKNVYTDSGIDTLTQQGLTDLGIYLPIETTSQEEIQSIIETIEVAPATPVVNFNLSYDVELIPVPDINKIYSLTTVESNVWDKPSYEESADETGRFEEVHVLSNFIGGGGGMFKISVSGVTNTCFELGVFNQTDNKWYNWNKVNSTKTNNSGDVYISTEYGSFNLGRTYYEGVIPDAGREVITISIPPVSSETVYRIGFLRSGTIKPNTYWGSNTNYASSLPMFDEVEKPGYVPTYKLTQLMRSSTTIKLEDSNLGSGNGDDVLVIKHAPGALLNVINKTKGKYSVDLNIVSRKQIHLSDTISGGILDTTHLALGDPATTTEVLNVDLVASVNSEGVGNVTGTITLGKASLRSCEIKLHTSSIFLTDQDK